MAEKEEDERQREGSEGAVKYKDVFEMSGEMAEQPISPRDAEAMRTAENRAFGKTLKEGPASLMLQAAAKNLEAGLVPPLDSSSSSLTPGATNILTDDKEATKEDAEPVMAAELRGGHEGLLGHEELRRHGERQSTTPGGVAEAVESAARINNPES